MATQVQWRGGSTAEHAAFTGAAREVTVDTQKQTLVLHDGSTAGGRPLLREDGSNAALSLGSAGTPSLKFTGDTNTGIYSPGADQVAVSTNGAGRLFVDASGNVQIGSSFAGVANGSGLEIERSTTAALRLTGASGVGCEFFNTGTLASIQTRSTIPFTIQTNELERLRITSAGLVGVGNSNPDSYNGAADDLVVGNHVGAHGITIASQNNTSGYIMFADGTTGAELYSGQISYDHVNNRMTFGTVDGTTGLAIDSSQRVGIGTASPDASSKLHVADGDVLISKTSGYASLFFNFIGVATTRAASIKKNYDSPFDLRIQGGNNSAAAPICFDRADGFENARFDDSGRLLVGTSSARAIGTQSLAIQNEGISFDTTGFSTCANRNDIYGPYIHLGKSRGTSVGSSTIVQSGDILGGIVFAGADGTDVDTQSGVITCEVDGTPGPNDMPGRLVFSTTADGASTPTERMRIDSGGTHQMYGMNDTLFSRTNRGAGTSYVTFAGIHSSTGPGTGTPSCFIYSNGNIQNTNNSYGAISDIKLKENIVDANSQWDDLKALQVRNYNFKEGQTHTQIGLVAQEAELVSPGLVSESPDRDAEGNDLGTVTKSVNYSVLYMKAVKALQEAMERIETLEAKVAALESA
jgi:hypothetical protein